MTQRRSDVAKKKKKTKNLEERKKGVCLELGLSKTGQAERPVAFLGLVCVLLTD